MMTLGSHYGVRNRKKPCLEGRVHWEGPELLRAASEILSPRECLNSVGGGKEMERHKIIVRATGRTGKTTGGKGMRASSECHKKRENNPQNLLGDWLTKWTWEKVGGPRYLIE